jgi:putative sterol carrier protein
MCIYGVRFLCYGIDGHVVVAGKCEGKPDATFSFADADFMAVSSGSINPQMAFIRYRKGAMDFIPVVQIY